MRIITFPFIDQKFGLSFLTYVRDMVEYSRLKLMKNRVFSQNYHH